MLTAVTFALATTHKNYAALFDDWKSEHGKEYASAFAEAKAFRAFAHAEDKITAHNAVEGVTFQLGHNEFSDLTADEFFATRLGYNSTATKAAGMPHTYTAADLAATPDSLDWVAKGAVTPVKNQGQCGSCWSFSTTGALEGAFQIAGNPLTSFSEEDLVQCDLVDSGCQGGLMDNAFKWVETNGISLESSYPYTSGTGIRGMCSTSKEGASVATITGFKDVASEDEDALKTAVALGPVSVAIEADKSIFQHYKSGVLKSKSCGTNLDHGVLVVGYGTEKGLFGETPYWKVKNSWGSSWGDQGYIKLERGSNMCGVASQPSYPIGAQKKTQ